MKHDKDTIERIKKEILVMKCVGNILGISMTVIILTIPFYTNVSWVNAIGASFLGLLIPYINFFVFKSKPKKTKRTDSVDNT